MANRHKVEQPALVMCQHHRDRIASLLGRVPSAMLCADRRDMIWINCNPQAGLEMKDIHPLSVLSPKAFNERTGIVIGLPMTTASFNETNLFAVKFVGPKRTASYILGHQPKSFDWRAREAKPHPWKQIPADVFALACETLNQIITIGN